jgi:hypothetical protein
MEYGSKIVGTATIAAAGNTEIIAAPAAGKRLVIEKIIMSFGTHSATGTVSVDDGTTPIIGPMVCTYTDGVTFDFGPDGYPFGAALACRLVNATENVTARATVIARVVG